MRITFLITKQTEKHVKHLKLDPENPTGKGFSVFSNSKKLDWHDRSETCIAKDVSQSLTLTLTDDKQ